MTSLPTTAVKGRGAEALVKGSVTIAGHRTSLSLEPVFWAALRAATAERGIAINALIAEIDEARTTNLSSAVRVWLFEQAMARLGAAVIGHDLRDPAPASL